MKPIVGNTYKFRDARSYWKVLGFYSHPDHQPYHKNWSGEYAIIQESGNFKNEIKVAPLESFDATYELAWEPAKVCKFCGFTRMHPCTKRQRCPNLTDYKLEPDDEPQLTDQTQ